MEFGYLIHNLIFISFPTTMAQIVCQIIHNFNFSDCQHWTKDLGSSAFIGFIGSSIFVIAKEKVVIDISWIAENTSAQSRCIVGALVSVYLPKLFTTKDNHQSHNHDTKRFIEEDVHNAILAKYEKAESLNQQLQSQNTLLNQELKSFQ
jgi:hypothetical protein